MTALALVPQKPRYTLLSGHPASDHQVAIFDALSDPSSGSKLVIAVAGSGKTTVIKNGLRHIPAGSHVQGFAFNTDAARNLKAGLAEIIVEDGPERYRNVRMGTFHSVCYATILRHLGLKADALKPNGAKVRYILKARLTDHDHERYAAFVAKLVGLAKGEGIGALCADEEWRWYELVDHHGLYLDAEEATVERAVEIARKVLAYSTAVARAKHEIDFDDMLYLVAAWKLRLWQNDVVLIDEAQDTNPVRRAIARLALKPGGRLYAVGDPKQCHPAGTEVYVSGQGNVPIEELRVGDKVLTYCNGYFPGKSEQGRRITRIQKRNMTEDEYLIKLSAGDFTHLVTPKHRCWVRMTERSGSIVYVMRKGSHARVGRCASKHGGDFGLGTRCRQEKADAAWVLAFFDDNEDDEAKLLEMRVAYEYGLPQTCFLYSWEKGLDPKLRDKFWARFPSNIDGLIVCLYEFNRQYECPFWEKGRGRHIGRYSFELAACNIESGWFTVCTFGGDPHKPIWHIVDVLKIQQQSDVYSLEVEPNESGIPLYIANGIVTHNSIYGFTGASTDAMELLRTEFGCTELPLTVSYRCARAVVRQARCWVDYIEPADFAPDGEVRHDVPLEDALNVLTQDDAVLCRQTAPLVGLAYKLIAQGRGCRVLGREIGDGLVALVKAMRAKGIERLVEKLEAFRLRETARLIAKGQETKAEAVDDRVDCVMTIIRAMPENERTVPALERRIAALFDDAATGVLTLATSHRSKGQEWENVAVLRPDLMPSKAARQAWQEEQEVNLMYVTTTRAKHRLMYLAVEE